MTDEHGHDEGGTGMTVSQRSPQGRRIYCDREGDEIGQEA